MANEVDFRVRALYYMALSKYFWQYHPDSVASHYLIIMKSNICENNGGFNSILSLNAKNVTPKDKKLKKIVIDKLVKDIEYNTMINNLF